MSVVEKSSCLGSVSGVIGAEIIVVSIRFCICVRNNMIIYDMGIDLRYT